MRNALLALAALTVFGCNDEAATMLLTCEGGNMEACFNDGMAATDAARPDYGTARKSFSTACMSAHHPRSCYQLALLVRDAKGGPKDLARAFNLFDIACKPKAADAPPPVVEACVDVAAALLTGDGTREDPEKAMVLLETSCMATPSDARACALLGTVYAEAKGVAKKDVDKAAELYATSCTAKYADGCVLSGQLQISEKKRDAQVTAAAFYKSACELDARKGCFELAELHREGKWEGSSDKDASEYYQKTCSIDPTRGCFEAGRLMEEGRVEASEGSIEYLYHLACEHGHTEACQRRNVELDNKDDKKKKK